MNPLLNLNKLGQSIWYDNLRKGLITSGELKRMIDEYAVTGITSNPVIFERAVSGTSEYDEDISRLGSQKIENSEIAEKLVINDVKLAADTFAPVYGEAGGKDGFVCVETSPHLADDADATIKEARALYSLINRPNIMVKVPGTQAGLKAVEELTREGYNVNITLLFSVERYAEAALAYIKGLERRLQEGWSIDRISSAASFFVSRIDTLADKLIEERIDLSASNDEKARLKNLLGKTAVANAKLAYIKFNEIFKSDRFRRLQEEGANAQKLLWTSTSTKNPGYHDTKYVEELAEGGTVNSMPLQTLLAFYDHGRVRHRLSDDLEGSHKIIAALASFGIDYKEMTDRLEREGLELFINSYSLVLKAIAKKKAVLLEKKVLEAKYELNGFEGPVASVLNEIGNENFLERLWAKDPTIWKQGPEEKELIKDALGWLTLPDLMEDNKEVIISFAEGVRQAGFKNAVLLGMGGSSLAPLVLSEALDAAPGYPKLIVLDSTDPDAVNEVTRSIDPAKTIFILSSKSGSTIEPLSLFDYFYNMLYELKGEDAGGNFIAITDPGTPLEGFSKKYRFRKLFANPHDIGGRFSALSYFGLVPAAICGVDISKLLNYACNISAATHPCMKEKDNPVVLLGAALGIFGRSGKDKITFFLSKNIASFGLWIEQLVAESTGKEGKGLIPVVNEPPGGPDDYDKDRVFVHISSGTEDDEIRNTLSALAGAGHPVISFKLKDPYELGGEFLRWEVATAVAGQILGINPFDQPDVELAKKLTRARLRAIEKGIAPPPGIAMANDRFKIYFGEHTFHKIKKTASKNGDVKKALREFMGLIRKGDYVGVLAYFNPGDRAIDSSLTELRRSLRDYTKAATQFGYGPRYLHSIGQLHKGGANNGIFLILCHETQEDVIIPKSTFSFSELELSQAFGDMEALDSKGCRVALLNLKDSSLETLEEAESLIRSAVMSASGAVR